MIARTELHKMIRRRINMLPDSPEKKVFEKDVSILFSLDNNQSLQGITAGAWLGELSPTCRGGGFVRRLVFKFPPKIRQPLFLQACPLRHYRIGLLSPQRYFFLKYSMHR